MANDFEKFIGQIENDSKIDAAKKEKLLIYLKETFRRKIRIYSSSDYENILNILLNLNYDVEVFDKLLSTSYFIKNSINAKNGSKYKSQPNVTYVETVYLLFSCLDNNFEDYNSYDYKNNVILARVIHKIINDGEFLNGEISILDLAKQIYNKYHSNSNNFNQDICKIFKTLTMIEKGLQECDNKEEVVFRSKELMELFEKDNGFENLYFIDIVKEFYPIFGNDLFVYIKNASYDCKEKFDTNYVIKYLINIEEKREIFDKQKSKIVGEVSRIDVEVEKNVESTFVSFIKTIESNHNIDPSVSKSIVQNIRSIFARYLENQSAFVGEKLNDFFDNCTSYINNLVLPGSKNGIDELVGELVSNCKDFFVEYDSKKFKEIVDYLIDNTDLTVGDLRELGNKCARFFKEADINKLKAINSSLQEFKKEINEKFGKSDLINSNIFDVVLKNNPELLLNNKIDEVIDFVSGRKSLDDYGYKYRGFALNKDFLSYNFYKMMVEDNYKILFKSSMGRLIDNLNYLEEKCELYNIKYKEFNFNENTIYALLSKDLYSEGTNVIGEIKNLFNDSDFKKIIESNPELFMISSSDLEIIVKRCMFNENDGYPFHSLLASELYLYRVSDFKNKSSDDLLNKDFKFIDLGISASYEIDPMEIVTSSYIDDKETNNIWDTYNMRRAKAEVIDSLLDTLDSGNFVSPSKTTEIINKILNLYNEIYSKVPNVYLKNRLVDIASDRMETYEYQISDNNEKLEAKKALIPIYLSEKKDSDIIVERLNELIESVESQSLRRYVRKVLSKFKEERKRKSDEKYSETTEMILELEKTIFEMDREVENLNYFLSLIDSNSFIDGNYEEINSFSINSLKIVEDDVTDDKSKVESLLKGRNLIIFSNVVDLEDIPNDKDFVEKVYKFLGDTEFSIMSKEFMSKNTLDKDFVEKFVDHREEIWSRRENRTPVRVYFIPVHTKYFTCYYVVNVNYKDHNHLDGGCSSDEVYRRRVREAKALENKINSMSYNELLEYIKQTKESYNEVMEPIFSKMHAYEKKRKGKK